MKLLNFIFFLIIISSCSSEEEIIPEPVDEIVTDSIKFPIKEVTLSKLASYTSAQMRFTAQLSGYQEVVNRVQYGVDVYKMTYNTTYNKSPITASGLYILPINTDSTSLPLITVNHGTTFKKNDAPSVYSGLSEVEFFAAAGYATIVPDYLGFGESSQLHHPYYHRESSSIPIVDMIYAGIQAFDSSDFTWNKKLYITGYSQGGYVTMATSKYIAEHDSLGLTPTAVAAGAGGYNLDSVMDILLNKTEYNSPNYIGYVIQSYNNTYSWGSSYNRWFQAPFDSKIIRLYSGELGSSEINSELTNIPKNLLTVNAFDTLIKRIPSNLYTALLENSVHDWTPSFPLRLYHGTKDEQVPIEDSRATYNTIKTKTSKEFKIVEIEGGTHSSAFIPMLEDVIPWFETF